MMRAYIKLADTLSTSIGKAFSWCIVILMGGTCYEVMMAYVFNKPTLWNFDFSMQMYGAILMMSGAYCLATESHVRGDVIYRLFKPRTQGYIDLVLYFIFFFPGVVSLAFYGYEYAALARLDVVVFPRIVVLVVVGVLSSNRAPSPHMWIFRATLPQ